MSAQPEELIEHRTLKSKTFMLPDGRIKISSRIRPMHWNDNGTWVDADPTPVSEDGEVWATKSTSYHLSWDTERVELHFQNKIGGEITIRLIALDDLPVSRPTSRPKTIGRSVKSFVAPELELELRTRSHGVELFKILHGPRAPRKLTWQVIEDISQNVFAKLMDTAGRDNFAKSEKRKREHPLNRQRLVEILHSRSEDDLLTYPGKRTYTVTEEFTGRTRFVDPVSRARSWVQDVEWPVEIDVTLTTHITAAEDDGRSYDTDYWRSNAVQWRNDGLERHGGFRFLSINIAQGVTLDTGTLTFNVVTRGGTQNATLVGQNVDTAPTWVNASAFSPKTMSATTATLSYATPATAGSKVLDVKAICQEIINRAGWVANNNIRLGFSDVSAMTTSYVNVEDYSDAGTAEAVLELIYTPAAIFGSNFYRQVAGMGGGI